jgi:hypothetical protein
MHLWIPLVARLPVMHSSVFIVTSGRHPAKTHSVTFWWYLDLSMLDDVMAGSRWDEKTGFWLYDNPYSSWHLQGVLIVRF